jgi:hypothetical protein
MEHPGEGAALSRSPRGMPQYALPTRSLAGGAFFNETVARGRNLSERGRLLAGNKF